MEELEEGRGRTGLYQKKNSFTFIAKPVGLLATAVLPSPAEHLEVVRLLLRYHHQHRQLAHVRVLQVRQLGVVEIHRQSKT